MNKTTKNEFTKKEYAEYMMANYYLDYTDTALYFAIVLFEEFVMEKVKKYKNKYIKEKKKIDNNYWFNLNDAIELYIDKGYWKSDVLHQYLKMSKDNTRKELMSYKDIRNDIAHTKIQNNQIDHSYDSFMNYVYTSLTGEPKSNNFFKKKSSNQALLQDYKKKEIEERMLSRLDDEFLNPQSDRYINFEYISARDFENLFSLREKMVFVKKAITNYSKEFGLGLSETILSPIDTTSAYIWMPFINQDFTDFTNKFETKRNNLITGSASILATPLDFRIYIDFGGGDFKYRMLYQDFLQSERFKTYIQRYRNLVQPLEIFDIRWYSFITKRNDLFEILDSDQLDDFVKLAKKRIGSAEKSGEIMTTGYNKIGFILPVRDIKLSEIIKLFECITQIYYEFLQFSSSDKKSLDMLKEKQEKLQNRCKYDKK